MKKLLLAIGIFLILGAASVSYFLNTERGKLMVVRALTERLETQTGYSFEVEEWSFSLPFRLNAKKVTVDYKDHVVAQAEIASISLKPLALLNSKLIISDLSLEDVLCYGIAAKGSSQFPARNIELQNFKVKRLKWQGTDTPIDIAGEATLKHKTLSVTSTLTIHNTQVFSHVKVLKDEVGMYVRFVEPQNGYITKSFELPAHAPFACMVELSGKLAAWKQWLFAGANPKHFPIKGQVTLDYPNLDAKATVELHAESDTPFYIKDIVAKHKGLTLDGEMNCDALGNIQNGKLGVTYDLINLKCQLAGNLLSPAFFGTLKHPAMEPLSLVGKTEYADKSCRALLKLSSEQFGCVGLETTISPLERWPLTLTYSTEPLNCEAKGNWKLTPESFIVCLESGKGKFLEYDLSLKDPIILRNLEISPLIFNLDKGTVHVTLEDWKKEFRTTTKARDLPYSLIQKFLPELPITSTVSLDAHIYGKPSSLQGHIQMELDKIQILDEMFSSIPPLSASCRATLKDKSLECVGKIVGIGPDAVRLEARLPYSCTLKPPLLQHSEDDTFFARFTASGDIAPYLQLFYTDTTQIKGKTDIAIDITGPMNAPHIVGRAKLYEGSFESRDFGTNLQNIEALIEGEGDNLVLKELSATTDGSQTLSGTGQIHLSAKNNLPFNIALVLKRAPFLQLDSAKIWTSGELHIMGTTKGSTLSGQLLVDNADFTIPKQLLSAIQQVEITYVNQPEEEATPTPSVKTLAAWPMDLQVKLRSPGTISIKGKDLNTTWKGDVLLTGEPGAIRLFGDLYALDGEYKLNGQIFNIDQGTINLAGEFSRQASLNVVAYREINNTRAEMVLKGPMNNPGVLFQSDPPLAQQEVLSLILFNKPLPDLSAHQGDQLKKTFSALSTQGESTNFLGKMRDVLGIDLIDITQNETVDVNEVSVRLGKYFHPGFYLFYNQSMPSDSKKVAVEANLMKELKMEAELDDDINGQIMLKWKHDY